jgi:hypothetical protein
VVVGHVTVYVTDSKKDAEEKAEEIRELGRDARVVLLPRALRNPRRGAPVFARVYGQRLRRNSGGPSFAEHDDVEELRLWVANDAQTYSDIRAVLDMFWQSMLSERYDPETARVVMRRLVSSSVQRYHREVRDAALPISAKAQWTVAQEIVSAFERKPL